MINNYQREAGEEDDRDSGSLTVLAPLAQGDQASGGKFKLRQRRHLLSSYFFVFRSGLSGEVTGIPSFIAIHTN